MFVVQKHAATRLHYDFRLEMEGVLKSWAVPKGFPTQRGDRRLAIQVEDHPIEYGDFEGTIPRGNYGAGTVMVWDTGVYEVIGEQPEKALKHGKLHLLLKGKKLKSEWVLVRIQPADESKPQWLLMKTGSDISPFSESVENRSSVSERTMTQIAAAGERQWQSDRSTRKSRPLRQTISQPRSKSSQSRISHPPNAKFIEPMKARLVDQLPEGKNWLYEIKFDGVRALAIKSGKTIQLVSRAAKDLTFKYSSLAEKFKNLRAINAIIDGEIVALDPEGRPSFQLLQCYQMPASKKPPLFFYAFDLIQLEGKDLSDLPLIRRKDSLKHLLAGVSDSIRFSGELPGSSTRLAEQLRKRGLEGLMAKQKDSKYEAGRRSGAWLKDKWGNEQEFIIGGYTKPKHSRTHFGAILVGYYDNKRLLFAAKVGTGFNEKLLTTLFKQFQQLRIPGCPFANLPEKGTSRGRGLSLAEMRRCVWVKPKLVCQARFAEWTRDGHLRQPVFLGLRQDKLPHEVVREKPAD